MKLLNRPLPFLSLALLLSAAGGGVLYAQLEGADRGVPPIESTTTFEVTGVEVDVTAGSAEEARIRGWREAQSKGWRALWASTNKRPQSEAPDLPDSVINAMVSGIVIEQEQIGPRRYIARLGVLFDRARSGEMLGVSGFVRQSHPMLVIPILQTGSSRYGLEFRSEWQRAWARFRTVNSAIDYVRPTGSGVDPLLLNATQTGRPGRGWWRMLVDQYGAEDLIVPEVRLRRSYPGGPAIGIFSARHGPDNQFIARFALRAGNSASIPAMMDEGVRRLDAIYTRALAAGLLAPDRTLETPEPPPIEDFLDEPPQVIQTPGPPAQTGAAAIFSIQVLTPAPETVGAAELAVSRVNGVTSALTTSLAIGGTSVMRVTYVGDTASLASALQAQGWNVDVLPGNHLRISR